VRTARLQILATAPDYHVDFPRPVYRRWGYDYWQQLPDRRVVLGGLRDRSGEGEWTDVAHPTDPVQRGLDRLLREQLGVDAPVTHRWAGIVGYSTDGLPVVANPRPDVWATGGYSGTGNVLGALCGRGVARLAITGDAELVHEFWSET
ncbi:MAG: FAD-dependent oxidoreductase, partial [Gemmatimonadaceae bacterium]